MCLFRVARNFLNVDNVVVDTRGRAGHCPVGHIRLLFASYTFQIYPKCLL